MSTPAPYLTLNEETGFDPIPGSGSSTPGVWYASAVGGTELLQGYPPYWSNRDEYLEISKNRKYIRKKLQVIPHVNSVKFTYSPAVWVRKYLNEYPNQRLVPKQPNPHSLLTKISSLDCWMGFFFRKEERF